MPASMFASCRSAPCRLWRLAHGVALLLAGFWVSPLRATPDATTLVSGVVSRDGTVTAGDGASSAPRLSADGAFVVFQSTATDLSATDADATSDIYRHEVDTGALVLISVSTIGRKGDRDSRQPDATADGSSIVFASDATNLALADTNGASDVFVRDTGVRPTTDLISVNVLGQTTGNGASDQPAISTDGSVVVFRSLAGDLVGRGGAASRVSVIYLRDRSAAQTRQVLPVRADGAPITPDGDSSWPDVDARGTIVVFETEATNIVPGDRNGASDVIRYNVASQTFSILAVDARGRPFSGGARRPSISDSGTRVAFEATGDDGVSRVYVRDTRAAATVEVSVDASGEPTKSDCHVGQISADGDHVVFDCEAPLSRLDLNETSDVYVHQVSTGQTTLVSFSSRTRAAEGSLSSRDTPRSSISADGAGIGFASESSRLASTPTVDANRAADVFLAAFDPAAPPPLEASNHVMLYSRQRPAQLFQVGLDGNLARSIGLTSPEFGGAAIDDSNTLWVADGATLRRVEALRLNELISPPLQLPGAGDVHGLVARDDLCYVARGGELLLLGVDGQLRARLVLTAGGSPEAVSLAIDPAGEIVVGVATADTFELVHADAALGGERRTRFDFAARGEEPYRRIALDPTGSVYARSPRELARFDASDRRLWLRPLEVGTPIVVDGASRAYTVAGGDLLGFDTRGTRFLRVDLVAAGLLGAPPGADGLEADLLVDGEQAIWVLVEGVDRALRHEPADARSTVISGFPPLDSIRGAETSGFPVANVHDPDGDADRDAYPNREEIETGFNPFAPGASDLRLPPFIDGRGTPAGSQVDLEWTVPIEFCDYRVFRNGRELAAKPVSCGEGLICLSDPDVPGGVHVYRIVGIGDCRGGGGKRRPKGPAPTPESSEFEVTVHVGDEGQPGTCFSDFPSGLVPTAVAISADGQTALAALETGLFTRWDVDLESGSWELADSFDLPAVPFGSVPVVGIAFRPDLPQQRAHVLTRDGELFEVDFVQATLEGDVVDLPSIPGSLRADMDDYAYSGLVRVGDTFFTVQNATALALVGPGIDCLIGYQGGSVIATQVLAAAGGLFDDRQPQTTGGLSLLSQNGLDASLLVGVGTGENLEAALRIDADEQGGAYTFADAGAAISLEAFGAAQVLGLAYDGSTEQLVAPLRDVGNLGAACSLGATFPPAPQLELTPRRGKWDAAQSIEARVVFSGTGEDFDTLPVLLKANGEELDPPAPQIDGARSEATFSVDLPAELTPRVVSVTVQSALGIDTVDFIYGFRRGDGNNDGGVDIADALYVLLHLFRGDETSPPQCVDALDVDDSGGAGNGVDITDAVVLLTYLFLGQSPPQAPFSQPGTDRTVDATGCGEPS